MFISKAKYRKIIEDYQKCLDQYNECILLLLDKILEQEGKNEI